MSISTPITFVFFWFHIMHNAKYHCRMFFFKNSIYFELYFWFLCNQIDYNNMEKGFVISYSTCFLCLALLFKKGELDLLKFIMKGSADQTNMHTKAPKIIYFNYSQHIGMMMMMMITSFCPNIKKVNLVRVLEINIILLCSFWDLCHKTLDGLNQI